MQTKAPIQRNAPLRQNITLKLACKSYLQMREHNLRPRSREAYRYHFRTLQKFFQPDKPLSTFHEGHFREYQKWRISHNAGPSLINHEMGALAQLLELADLWHPVSRHYERLGERAWEPPKVMSTEEEERFIRFARRKESWRTALNSALITGNTTVLGDELRNIRLEHLKLNETPCKILVHPPVKARNRVRSIPLNDVALAAVLDLVALAKDRGASEPQHYLIPYRVKKGFYDPTRPASACFIRSAFRAIGKSSNLPWVTPRTFRHQAITKLLENGAPDETVRAIAGHGTERAMVYYSHIRIEAKRAALDRLSPNRQITEASRSDVSQKSFPLLQGVRATAKRLGISENAALELVLSFVHDKGSASR